MVVNGEDGQRSLLICVVQIPMNTCMGSLKEKQVIVSKQVIENLNSKTSDSWCKIQIFLNFRNVICNLLKKKKRKKRAM